MYPVKTHQDGRVYAQRFSFFSFFSFSPISASPFCGSASFFACFGPVWEARAASRRRGMRALPQMRHFLKSDPVLGSRRPGRLLGFCPEELWVGGGWGWWGLYTNCFPFALWLVELLCYTVYVDDYDVSIRFRCSAALRRGVGRRLKGVTGWICLEFGSNTCSN